MISLFLSGVISTFGMCLLFNIRRRHSLLAALGGGLSALLYHLLSIRWDNTLLAIFGSALIISLYSEVLASREKTPATTYAIPGILPLVPGAGMYYTMLHLVGKDLALAASHGYQTIFSALAIACGIIIAPSIRRLYRQLKAGKAKDRSF